MIALIGIHLLLQRARGEPQCLRTQPRLDRLEIDRVGGAATDQRFDFVRERGLEVFLEPFFLAASTAAGGCLSDASQSASLTSTNSWLNARKRRYSSNCAWVWATAGPAGMIRVTVLPATARVSEKLGPCPGSPGVAQWQLGLPHLRKRAVNCPGRRSPSSPIAAFNACRRAASCLLLSCVVFMRFLPDSIDTLSDYQP
ncbi:MAG: hypothetical protein CO182_03605 [Lysobacterales bacterium CG_4_9_14_3_um_filter_62_6]|nr:MAG: hypothetical protein CO182_03605 [Xanthomonadales bacterium CG_4_9_14_3_um_filter_62_6]